MGKLSGFSTETGDWVRTALVDFGDLGLNRDVTA
jgi:hypothetical protein